MSPEDAAAKLQNLGAEIKFRHVRRLWKMAISCDILCSCGYRWCDLKFEDLPRVLADRENGRCSESHS